MIIIWQIKNEIKYVDIPFMRGYNQHSTYYFDLKVYLDKLLIGFVQSKLFGYC